VAVAIAFLSGAASPGSLLDGFDRIALLVVAGGLATSLLALPLRTRPAGTPAAEVAMPGPADGRVAPVPAPAPTVP
jgi:hypothetical protein